MNEHMTDLLKHREGPCLSLYQPTHRRHPENRQDPIRFRNLVGELEKSLTHKYGRREIEPLLEPFHRLSEDREFWNHTRAGLAVFAAPGLFRAHRLPRGVPELAVVADSFHIKPLLRVFQAADRYQLLALDRKKVALYEGDRDSLDEVPLAEGVPHTITEALGGELTEPHETVASYGLGSDGPAMHHGHGTRKDEVDVDAERFFRAVDRAVTEHHSRPSGLPLVLAALPANQSTFRGVSHNDRLMDTGIDADPDSLDPEAMRERAWALIAPRHDAQVNALVEAYEEASAKDQGSDGVAAIAAAAVGGRVATLLIDNDRNVPGRLDRDTGRVDFDDLEHPDVDDLLDDLGELVLTRGGEVVVVPAERMPGDTGAAAIYRY